MIKIREISDSKCFQYFSPPLTALENSYNINSNTPVEMKDPHLPYTCSEKATPCSFVVCRAGTCCDVGVAVL